MTTMPKYDWTTAEAVCNDSIANTWEVRAKDAAGCWWTVSDSCQMTEADAESLAASMRAIDE